MRRFMSFRDFDCVIVDDASTDTSAAVVQQVLDELADPRFRLIRLDRNVGQTGATRRGLAAVQAPFVCFLDSDDLWNEDFLERPSAGPLPALGNIEAREPSGMVVRVAIGAVHHEPP